MKYIGILVMFFFTVTLSAQSFLGTIDYGKLSINYKIKLAKIDNHTSAFFSSVEMNAYEIPCQNATFEKDSLECSRYETEKQNYLRNHRVVIIKFFYHEVKTCWR